MTNSTYYSKYASVVLITRFTYKFGTAPWKDAGVYTSYYGPSIGSAVTVGPPEMLAVKCLRLEFAGGNQSTQKFEYWLKMKGFINLDITTPSFY